MYNLLTCLPDKICTLRQIERFLFQLFVCFFFILEVQFSLQFSPESKTCKYYVIQSGDIFSANEKKIIEVLTSPFFTKSSSFTTSFFSSSLLVSLLHIKFIQFQFYRFDSFLHFCLLPHLFLSFSFSSSFPSCFSSPYTSSTSNILPPLITRPSFFLFPLLIPSLSFLL